MGEIHQNQMWKEDSMYGPDTDTSKMTKAELRAFQSAMHQRRKQNRDATNVTKCKTTLKTSTTISYDVQEINERLRFCMSKLLC